MSRTRWAVAIQSKTVPWDIDLSKAICRCFQELGHTAFLAQDGDPAGLEADVLLMLNVLGNYPVYYERLKRGGSQRPITILWQMDPLPPVDLPPEAEHAGLQAARLRDSLWLRQPADMPRWKKLCTFYRSRVWAYQNCSALGFRKACRLIKCKHSGDFDWIQIRGVMENWQDILSGYNEGWMDHLVVSTNQRRHFLMHRGVPAHFIPIGADEHMGRNMKLKRDISVGFLGYVKYGRRAATLERLGERLKKRGVTLTRVEKDCYGEQRCEWLNRSRIIVNLHTYAWNPAWIRFLMAARCGALVVSEPMHDEHPMIAGVHYVAATLEEMPEVICSLLDDPEKMDKITSAAASLCQNELTLLHAVEKLSGFGSEENLE